ncbi:MAG: hypothetical protein GC161_15395 [Planctomycetaceae bacterium]|nr:hypothetical protein [Planctomycetaceae bacterium]
MIIGFRGWTNRGDRFAGGRTGGELGPEFRNCLERTLTSDNHSVDVWCPRGDMGMFSMASPESVAKSMFAQISQKVSEDLPDRIVFLGFSAGSLVARRVFSMAHGVGDDAVVRPDTAAPWAHRIHRMVVLSGITRGWDWTSESPPLMRFSWPVLMAVTRVVGWAKWKWPRRTRRHATPYERLPFVWQIERGTPFVVSTRLQYLALLQHLRRSRRPDAPTDAAIADGCLLADGMPSTVFLLGAQDELVSPADCTELGPRAEFVYIELPNTSHRHAIAITGESPIELLRRERLAAALSHSVESLTKETWSVQPADIDDYLDPMGVLTSQRADTTGKSLDSAHTRGVRSAYFVLHGIRDHGFWTKRVAREIKVAARARGELVAAATPSYGYFSAWDFVRPFGRERATRWFMEKYADLKSHNPDADITFVGHSNGTYIAARALELCPAIRFRRMLLAGSVVRRSFPWSRHRSQAPDVLNFVATRDVVVAFLPAVFERLRLPSLDVGGGGVWGFDEFSSNDPPATAQGHNVTYVRGGHAAAISQDYWRAIADFAVDGTKPKATAPRPAGWNTLFGLAPFLTVPGAIVPILLIFAHLLVPISCVLFATVDRTDLAWFSVALVGSSVLSWVSMRLLREI